MIHGRTVLLCFAIAFEAGLSGSERTIRMVEVCAGKGRMVDSSEAALDHVLRDYTTAPVSSTLRVPRA